MTVVSRGLCGASELRNSDRADNACSAVSPKLHADGNQLKFFRPQADDAAAVVGNHIHRVAEFEAVAWADNAHFVADGGKIHAGAAHVGAHVFDELVHWHVDNSSAGKLKMHFVPQHRATERRGIVIDLLDRRRFRFEFVDRGLFLLDGGLAFGEFAVQIEVFLLGRTSLARRSPISFSAAAIIVANTSRSADRSSISAFTAASRLSI